MAIHILFVDPARVNPAAFNARVGIFLHAKAVVHLDLIAALQVNARVRMLGDAELNVQFDVAKLGFGDQVDRSSGGSVDHHAQSRRDGECLRFAGLKRDVSSGQPIADRFAPAQPGRRR